MQTGRTLIVLLLIVLAVAILGSLATTGMMGGGMMGGYYGFSPWSWWMFVAMIFRWLAGLAFIGALVAGMVLLIRVVNGPLPSQAGPAAGEDPLMILKHRYARGEITREEYEQARRVLTE